MNNPPPWSAIIVAAGSGSRMGFDKLVAPLAGQPVLQHSIEAFLACPGLLELIIVTTADRFHQCLPAAPPCPVLQVDGGSERHHSVAAGLARVSSQAELIAVHDGARPLIRPQQILRTLEVARTRQAATSAHRITDTLKRADAQQVAVTPVDRSHLWAMETPQIFDASLLHEAYEKVTREGRLVTDEVSAVECCGIHTSLVENPSPNLKITYPQDLPLASHLLKFNPPE